MLYFIDWKQNKKQDKTQSKEATKNKTNIETERQKHAPWKQNQQQKKKKNNLPKMKATWVGPGDVRKVCLKETSKH